MYARILVAVEHSPADQTILGHVRPLARLCGARLLLVHVADGWAARYFDELKLRESQEIQEDRAYLDTLRAELSGDGFDVETCHRLLKDLVLGATVDKVRHDLEIPVLLLKAREA